MSETPPFRAVFDKPTGLLIVDGDGLAGACSLDQWEAHIRDIRAAMARARADAYEGKWPPAPALPEV